MQNKTRIRRDPGDSRLKAFQCLEIKGLGINEALLMLCFL